MTLRKAKRAAIESQPRPAELSPDRLEAKSRLESQDGCAELPNTAIKVRIVPQQTNLKREDVPALERLVGCKTVSFAFGTSTRFPGRAINSIAYRSPLDCRFVKRILEALEKQDVRIQHICSHVYSIVPGYMLLAHYSYDDDRPLSENELARLRSAKSQQAFEEILVAHECHGSWPIVGEAANR